MFASAVVDTHSHPPSRLKFHELPHVRLALRATQPQRQSPIARNHPLDARFIALPSLLAAILTAARWPAMARRVSVHFLRFESPLGEDLPIISLTPS
jgi:hypothetical protein